MKNRILVFGSCVTRDIFNYSESFSLKFVDIFARCNPISLLSLPISGNFDYSKNESKFQQRMIHYDIKKVFFDRIQLDDYDWIVFDLIDTRFEVIDIDGKYFLTKSNEIQKADLFGEHQTIPDFPSLIYKNLYTQSLKLIYNELKKIGKHTKIILNAAKWADKYLDGSPIDYYTKNYINKNNIKCEWCYNEFIKIFNCPVIEYEEIFICAKKNHTWGEMPFHYDDIFYIEQIRQLTEIINSKNISIQKQHKNIILSIDVEALPSRTLSKEKVTRLMWGEIDGEYWGVPKIIDILNQYKIISIFYVELATFLSDKSTGFRLMRYIKSRGHHIGFHLHMEVLPKDSQHQSMKEIFFKCVKLYKECFNEQPISFRAGGLYYNREMLEWCKECGITFTSNYFINPYFSYSSYQKTPNAFQWNNGLKELPVSYCLDEIFKFQDKDKIDEMIKSIVSKDTTHFFIHSWSLLERDNNGTHDKPSQKLVEVFKYSLKKLNSIGNFVDPLSFLTEKMLPIVKISNIGNIEPLRHMLDFPEIQKGHSPLSTKHFSIGYTDINIDIEKISLFDFENEISPMILPITLLDYQIPFRIRLEKNNIIKYIYYIFSKGTAYIQINREEWPFPEYFDDVIIYMKNYDNSIKNIIFSRILELDKNIKIPCTYSKSGSTYILSLDHNFDYYNTSTMKKTQKKEIDYNKRRLNKDCSSVTYSFFNSKEMLSSEMIIESSVIIYKRLIKKAISSDNIIGSNKWIEKNLDLYKKYGLVCFMLIDDKIAATHLGLIKNNTFYYTGSGFIDSNYTKFSISKILFLELIKYLYTIGIKKINCGGGDFGFKEKFGAHQIDYYSGEIKIDSYQSLEKLISAKIPYEIINKLYGTNITSTIFETTKFIPEVDKQFSLSPSIPGWTGYSYPISDAVYELCSCLDIPTHSISFFNCNSGFGHTDFNLSNYPFKNRGGLFVERRVYDAFTRTCQKINFSNFRAILSENIDFSPNLISDFNVFFAYNPCNMNILRLLIEKIINSLQITQRNIYFIYLNCKFNIVLEEYGFKKIHEKFPVTFGWRFTVPASIYLFEPEHSNLS